MPQTGVGTLSWAGVSAAMTVGAGDRASNTECLFVVRGEAEEALDCLEKAVQLGFGLWGCIENDADLLSLRAIPGLRRCSRACDGSLPATFNR